MKNTKVSFPDDDPNYFLPLLSMVRLQFHRATRGLPSENLPVSRSSAGSMILEASYIRGLTSYGFNSVPLSDQKETTYVRYNLAPSTSYGSGFTIPRQRSTPEE